MTRAAEEILKEALELPEEDRDRIADSLWQSVDHSHEQSVEEAWDVEIARRIAEIDEGKVELKPWDETMARLKARLGT